MNLMEKIIKEIELGVNSQNIDILRDNIKCWREEFKNKGLSLYTLETLLKHYSSQNLEYSNDDRYGFYSKSEINELDQDVDSKIVALRDELESLKRNSREKEKKNNKRKYCFFILLVILSCSIALNIYFFHAYICSLS